MINDDQWTWSSNNWTPSDAGHGPAPHAPIRHSPMNREKIHLETSVKKTLKTALEKSTKKSTMNILRRNWVGVRRKEPWSFSSAGIIRTMLFSSSYIVALPHAKFPRTVNAASLEEGKHPKKLSRQSRCFWLDAWRGGGRTDRKNCAPRYCQAPFVKEWGL